MVSESRDATQSIQLGLRDLLMGWDEQARLHFRAAVRADETCALAWAGLMLTEGVNAESRSALEQILTNEYAATPQETALLSSLLRLAQGDRSGAGEEFAARAAQFRADTLSACWAVLLLHDGYDSISRKPLPTQERALELAQQLYERDAKNPLFCYFRGWVESDAPEPSQAALEAAQQAALSLPHHPAAQLLCGHLLCRNGQLTDALSHLRAASEEAEKARKDVPHGTKILSYPLELWPLEVRAKLYESSTLWMLNRVEESAALEKELLQQAAQIHPRLKHMPGAILLHAEARTLPLRKLLGSHKCPNDINPAVQAATPRQADKDDPLLDVRDCLRFCCVAIKLPVEGKREQALRCLKSAEGCFKRLEAARATCEQQGAYALSAWVRAHDACQQALFMARAAVYPDSEDFWNQSLEEARRKPATLLMPAVIPRQQKRHTK